MAARHVAYVAPADRRQRVLSFLLISGDEAEAIVGPEDNSSLLSGTKDIGDVMRRTIGQIDLLARAYEHLGVRWLAKDISMMAWGEGVRDRAGGELVRHLISTPNRADLEDIKLRAIVLAFTLPQLGGLVTLELSICPTRDGHNDVLLRAIGALPCLRHLALSGSYAARDRGESTITTDVMRSSLAIVLGAGSVVDGESGLVTIVLDHLRLVDDGGPSRLPNLLDVCELRFVDVVDPQWAIVSEVTILCSAVEILEWSVLNATNINEDVLEATFGGHDAIHTLILGRNFADGHRVQSLPSARHIAGHVVPWLDQLRHLHLGHWSLIGATMLLNICKYRLDELSVDVSGSPARPHVDAASSRSAFTPALAVGASELKALTVMSCTNDELRKILTVCDKSCDVR